MSAGLDAVRPGRYPAGVRVRSGGRDPRNRQARADWLGGGGGGSCGAEGSGSGPGVCIAAAQPRQAGQ